LAPGSHSHKVNRGSKEPANAMKSSREKDQDSLKTSYDENESIAEKKDISLQVDKGIVEAHDDSSQMILIEEQFLQNPNLFLKYLEKIYHHAGVNNGVHV
jgi:hypothetical protein